LGIVRAASSPSISVQNRMTIYNADRQLRAALHQLRVQGGQGDATKLLILILSSQSEAGDWHRELLSPPPQKQSLL
jgi:RecG-like helicase